MSRLTGRQARLAGPGLALSGGASRAAGHGQRGGGANCRGISSLTARRPGGRGLSYGGPVMPPLCPRPAAPAWEIAAGYCRCSNRYCASRIAAISGASVAIMARRAEVAAARRLPQAADTYRPQPRAAFVARMRRARRGGLAANRRRWSVAQTLIRRERERE